MDHPPFRIDLVFELPTFTCFTMANEEKPKSDPKPAQPDPHAESELPPDADVEERFNEFWKKNGAGIFGGIALGAAIVLGMQISDYMGERREAATQEAFQAADSLEAKEAFVAEYEDHSLAAVARLDLADAAFNDDDFTKAAELYKAAREQFGNPSLSGRAQLGEGISHLKAGQTEAGIVLLQGVAGSPSHIDQLRGEAAYHLAVAHWESNNLEKVRANLDLIETLDNARFWAFRANNLRDRIPQLATLTPGE